MTAIETQALLTAIYGHLDGRTGTVLSVGIRDGAAKVVIDYTTFAEVFAGQDVTQSGNTLSKAIGAVTYAAASPTDGTFSVPA